MLLGVGEQGVDLGLVTVVQLLQRGERSCLLGRDVGPEPGGLAVGVPTEVLGLDVRALPDRLRLVVGRLAQRVGLSPGGGDDGRGLGGGLLVGDPGVLLELAAKPLDLGDSAVLQLAGLALGVGTQLIGFALGVFLRLLGLRDRGVDELLGLLLGQRQDLAGAAADLGDGVVGYGLIAQPGDLLLESAYLLLETCGLATTLHGVGLQLADVVVDRRSVVSPE